MSVLHLASDVRSLAAKLAEAIETQWRDGDPFASVSIVVPNRYQRKWLRLWLARRLGVSINLQFHFLDDALWLLLRQLDPRVHAAPLEILDENAYRLLVLSVLLEEDDESLSPLRRYLQMQPGPLSRLTCRRAWHLADRLGTLLQEYEFHRQDQLIQPWLRGESALTGAGDFHRMMERAQRTLFQHLSMPRTGRRALLNRNSERRFETLPQYFLELESLPPTTTRTPSAFHFFGFTRFSALQTRVFAWLSKSIDLRVYHLNVLAERIDGDVRPGTLEKLAKSLAGTSEEESDIDPSSRPIRHWARPGIESLSLLGGLLDQPNFHADVLPAFTPERQAKRANRRARKAPAQTSALSLLQDQLLGRRDSASRVDQDRSLQIVGCAGAHREAETVYNSILRNLREQPGLRQTDIAVLVTDMATYRPALQAAFERPPLRLQYNLVDFNAAGLSMMGQAVVGMLDLALESFSRTRVFEVLLNPCFLARLGVEKAAAARWLGWAETLGVYQGWDADEKQQQGYPRSPFYAWKLGLQRLRLGRFMEVVDDDGGDPAPRFGHVIPFADLESSDRAQLDAFCRAVEGLLPTLARLRSLQGNGRLWARELPRLIQEFLAVPDDRREEEQVRAALMSAFDRLAVWDPMHDRPDRSPGLPLALVREYVRSQLVDLEGNKGEYLVGGVTIAELQPMRPVPFTIVFVVGLSEDLFPGSNQFSTFDLRGPFRQPGDVRPAEDRQHQFLEAVLAAQQKLYLLHNNLDVQKDQPLLPAVPLQQLQRYLTQNVVRHDFQAVSMPMHNDDERYYREDPQLDWQDVLVQYREVDRCLAFLTAQREHRLVLDPEQQQELDEKRRQLRADFTIVADPAAPQPISSTVSLYELRKFLQFPAQESMRRHLRVDDEDERNAEEDEPLVTPADAAHRLLRQSLQQLVMQAGSAGADQALATWQDRFAATYTDSKLRSLVPEEAFGEIDQAALLRDLTERVQGQGQIEAFLRQQSSLKFCGPVLLGESYIPLGAKLRFPALRLRPGRELPADAPQEVRVVGSTNFAWQNERVWQVLVVTQSKKIDAREIAPAMIEPALLHLAMLACDEPGADGVSPRKWIEKRDFFLSIAHREGIATWTIPAGAITPTEAVAYFTQLTADFLDSTRFDLLPFEVIAKTPETRRAFQSDTDVNLSPAVYHQLLEDLIAEERDSGGFGLKIPLLVDMVQAQVPTDAMQRVRRWFRLLDRGPALHRQHLAAGGRAPRRAKS